MVQVRPARGLMGYLRGTQGTVVMEKTRVPRHSCPAKNEVCPVNHSGKLATSVSPQMDLQASQPMIRRWGGTHTESKYMSLGVGLVASRDKGIWTNPVPPSGQPGVTPAFKWLRLLCLRQVFEEGRFLWPLCSLYLYLTDKSCRVTAQPLLSRKSVCLY